MEDAPDPTVNAEPAPEPQAAALVASEPAVAPVAAAPVQQPLLDLDSDPLARAMLDKARAEEKARLRAEAESDRVTERAALEAKLRAEAQQDKAAADAEAKRLEELSATDRLQEQIAELARKDAEREVRLEQANKLASEAADRLEFVRGFTDAGHRLAKQDKQLEDLAHSKAKALIASGKTMAEAITSLAETDDYLFARPAVASEPVSTSTAAGASAPRGATNPVRSPAQGAEFNAWNQSSDEHAAYMARQGWRDLVTSTKGNQVH